MEAAFKTIMGEIIERSCNVIDEKMRKLSILYLSDDNGSAATMQYLALLFK